MSSSPNQIPNSPESNPSPTPLNRPIRPSSPPAPAAATDMDQYSDSASAMTPSASPSDSPSTSSEQPPSVPPIADADGNEEMSSSDASASMRQQPIPPASEPMQYRAIGLVTGKYVPSEEQFTRGTLITEDGTPVDAVLLGRVMSLVKKHLDLEQPHLWVVYPRTRSKIHDLHLQIVGVWEPENLAKEDSQPEESTDESQSSPSAETEFEDGYFSIRGEIVYQSAEDEEIIVKINQQPRSNDQKGKSFKLTIKGMLGGKAVGYFWDLNVQRQGSDLALRDGTLIAMVPPKKRTERSVGGDRYGDRRRPPANNRRGSFKPPQRSGDRPSPSTSPSTSSTPSTPRPSQPKPVKRRSDSQPQSE